MDAALAPGSVRMFFAFTAFASLFFAMATPAAAEKSPPSPGSISAVAQYVEMLPTSAGPRPPGSASGKRQLPQKLLHEFRRRGIKDASLLVDAASSAAYGAPQQDLRRVKGHTTRESARAPVPPNRFSAAVESLDDAGGGRSLGLLVALALVTAGAIAAPVSRLVRKRLAAR